MIGSFSRESPRGKSRLRWIRNYSKKLGRCLQACSFTHLLYSLILGGLAAQVTMWLLVSPQLPHLAARRPAVKFVLPEVNSSFESVAFWSPDLQGRKLINTDKVGRLVMNAAPASPSRANETEKTKMDIEYLESEKTLPYVGHADWVSKFEAGTPKYFNSWAVFPGYQESPFPRLHGYLGVSAEGRESWVPFPMPAPAALVPGGAEAALKLGGFYQNLSDALPLDRLPTDGREEMCKAVIYDHANLPDASIVITFYNEPLSTLLRSVHSVLNMSPAPLLREIILVDDHSNLTDNLPGGPLYDYVKMLPKTKIMRLPERQGLVRARLAGARASRGDVLVVLDSHIEVNLGWLEPMLNRIKESPRSIVAPQILAINPETFEYDNNSGIGCWISFRWSMVEQSSMAAKYLKPDAVPQAAMAGGLFAVAFDWFWEIGGYDEDFTMWGAENVEMPFRSWMCGGRVECAPCSRTYHIYRKKGVGYVSPGGALSKNRLRTARLWTDEWFALAKEFVPAKHHALMGSLDKMLALKERLGCRSFKWFLQHVDPKHDIQKMSDVKGLGELKNRGMKNQCIDTLSHNRAEEEWGIFWCHGDGGTQGYLRIEGEGRIRSMANERLCLGYDMKLKDCGNTVANGWNVTFVEDRWWMLEHGPNCIGLTNPKGSKPTIKMVSCNVQDHLQHWTFPEYSLESQNYHTPTFSPEYQARRDWREQWKKEGREEQLLASDQNAKGAAL